jgi:hypothetical protein
MSLFDFPRINFKGTIQLNPGTANNDDYAQQPSAVIPDSFGYPYAGKALGLIDSKMVQARTFGMSDADFIAWVQKAHTFQIPGGNPSQADIIPAEWNYYGGMDSSDLAITVVGVQTAPDKIYSKVDPGVAATAVIGATLGYSGTITDVNSEGSPPATQFFIDGLTLPKATATLLSGPASKGACQWLNFYRNVNLQADGGAGGYVYHVMRKSDAGTSINLPGFDDPKIIGVICRYYLYRFLTKNVDIEKLYQSQGSNPAALEIVGTFAPLYADEKIVTGPVGRLLVSNDTNIPTPTPNNNGGGHIALGPAVLQSKGNIISADFSGTFPDNFQTSSNAKFDFGPVTLNVSNATESALIGPVDYATPIPAIAAAGSSISISRRTKPPSRSCRSRGQIQPARRAAQHPAGGDRLLFRLQSAGHLCRAKRPGRQLPEPGDLRAGNNLGLPSRPRTRPRRMPADQRLAVPFRADSVAWERRIDLATNFKPGQPLKVDTSQPGNFLLTFSIGAPHDYPPTSYNTFMMPPYITNAPSISLRILPNEDFSTYYEKDPKTGALVAKDSLTFDVVYQKVLRTYYLLYPVMKKWVLLNSEQACRDNASSIFDATNPDPAVWMSSYYMPRTRDMSASRRTLLRTWCQKVSKPSS